MYDQDGVRAVHQECSLLFALLVELSQDVGEEYLGEDSVRTTLRLYLTTIARNKRCLLAYHQYRWEKIQALIWERGGCFPRELLPKLSDLEVQSMNKYLSLTAQYQQKLDLLLFCDLQPPKDLFIEARVVQPTGEIFTVSGPMTLQQGSTIYVRRSEVETLIRQNSLKHL